MLEPLIDSVPALKIAQKYENLKLVEEKDSLFASNVSSQMGSLRMPEQALVASRPPAPQVPNQSIQSSSQRPAYSTNHGQQQRWNTAPRDRQRSVVEWGGLGFVRSWKMEPRSRIR